MVFRFCGQGFWGVSGFGLRGFCCKGSGHPGKLLPSSCERAIWGFPRIRLPYDGGRLFWGSPISGICYLKPGTLVGSQH